MSQRIFRLGITALTLAAITSSVVAPAAEAGRHRAGRYRVRTECGSAVRHSDSGGGYGHRRGRGRGCDRGRIEIHSEHTGAVLAGILGGIALGAVLSNASDRQPDCASSDRQPDCIYVDPYCGERFASLDDYHADFCHHRHPRVVRLIEVDSGRCLNTYRYTEGRWCDAEEWEEDYED